MLTYEYKCKKCKKEYFFETYVPYNGEKLQCPNCAGEDYEIEKYDPPYSEDSYSSGSFG